MIELSRKLRSTWTCGATGEPYVAVAMMHDGPAVFTCSVMSVLWLTDPLVPITWSTKLPVDPVEVVVKLTGELPVPPGGGVTVCGIVTPIPAGLFPTQEVEKVTGELNPPTELTITFVDPLRPGITETVT